MATACYFDSEILLWDDSIAAWDEDKCYQLADLFSTPESSVYVKNILQRCIEYLVNSESSYSSRIGKRYYDLLSVLNSTEVYSLLKVNRDIYFDVNSISDYSLRNSLYKYLNLPYDGVTSYASILNSLKLALIEVNSESSYSSRIGKMYYDLLSVLNSTEVESIFKLNINVPFYVNSDSDYYLYNSLVIYLNLPYYGVSYYNSLAINLQKFITNITSVSSVSLVNTTYIYRKIVDIYGSLEVFIKAKVDYTYLLDVLGTTHIGIFATLPADYSQVFLPLNKYRFKQDNLSSTLMNTEITNIYRLLSGIYNGEVSYGGVYKWVYNTAENSLDLMYKSNIIMRIDHSGNLSIKGVLAEGVVI